MYGYKSKISYVDVNIHLTFANSFNYFKSSKIVFGDIIGKHKKIISKSFLKERKLHMGTTYSGSINFCKIARKNYLQMAINKL